MNLNHQILKFFFTNFIESTGGVSWGGGGLDKKKIEFKGCLSFFSPTDVCILENLQPVYDEEK